MIRGLMKTRIAVLKSRSFPPMSSPRSINSKAARRTSRTRLQKKCLTTGSARNVGGRTMFWGRFANRFNENDFKMRSIDGQGLDWPIEYKDVAPYYDKAEIFMGVCGAKENHPDLPDSDNFLPPVDFKCYDVAIMKAADSAQ